MGSPYKHVRLDWFRKHLEGLDAQEMKAQGWRAKPIQVWEDRAGFECRFRPLSVTLSAHHVSGRRWLRLNIAHPSSIPTYLDVARLKDLFIGVSLVGVQPFTPLTRLANGQRNFIDVWACLDGLDRGALLDFDAALDGPTTEEGPSAGASLDG